MGLACGETLTTVGQGPHGSRSVWGRQTVLNHERGASWKKRGL